MRTACRSCEPARAVARFILLLPCMYLVWGATRTPTRGLRTTSSPYVDRTRTDATGRRVRIPSHRRGMRSVYGSCVP